MTVPRRTGRLGLAVLLASIITGSLLQGDRALAGGALPTGGQYVSGAGTIGGAGANLSVNQSSTTGVINWSSFSIGQGNSVNFNNGTGATLNEVTGGSLSEIAGSLHATGSIYLINPEGVIVDSTGQVVTGGSFVASTRDPTSNDPSSNKTMEFKGTSSGNVVNNGTIISNGGDAVLIGNAVTNNGTLSAKNGLAGMAAGNDVLLQPVGGDQRLFVSGGTGNVTNSGTVNAASAELRAAGGNVYALAGNNGGLVNAQGTANIQGHVWLTSNAGNVNVSGAVSAQNANGTGGTIVAAGSNVSVGATANISANGTTGGTILIGGDTHGGAIAADNLVSDQVADATTTNVAQGAQISANGSTGKGGNVVVWSQSSTDFAGNISATGATAGGFSEVSSHQVLSFTGLVDLLATNGPAGTLLLDPENVTINTTADGNETLSTASDPYTYTPNSASAASNILNTELETELGLASVEVNTGSIGTAAGDIAVSAPITWTSGTTLTLQAAGSISIGAAINGSGAGATLQLIALGTGDAGTINETAGGSIAIPLLTGSSLGNTTLTQSGNAIQEIGNFTVGNGTGIADFTLTNTGALEIVGELQTNPLNIDAAIVSLSSGSITEGGSGFIQSKELVTVSTSGSTTLTGTNSVSQLGDSTTPNNLSSAGDFSFTDTVPLTVNGTITANSGNITLTTNNPGSSLNIDANVSASNGTVTLNSSSTIDEGSATISANTLTGSADNDVELSDTGNDIANIGPFMATGGTFSLEDDASTVTVVGAITATGALNGINLGSTTGNLQINAALSATSVELTSATTIASNSSGVITATTLDGQAGGNVTLNANNDVADLGAFTVTGGDFSFTDAAALDVASGDTVSANDITLTTTAGNSLTIDGTLSAPSGTVDLVSGGTITDTDGTIAANLLEGSSSGDATLTSNVTTTDAGPFSTSNGNFALTTTGALTVTNPINAGTGNITLTTGGGGDLDLNATLTGTTVDLVSAGGIQQLNTNPDAITATTLEGSADGVVLLANQSNNVANLGGPLGFTVTGASFVFKDDPTGSALVVNGPVDATGGNGIAINMMNSSDDLTIAAAVGDSTTPGDVNLQSAGTITETSTGLITASVLHGSASGNVSLGTPGAFIDNLVADLGPFTTSGSFSLTDNEALDVTGGAVTSEIGSSPASTVTLDSTGNISIDAGVTGLILDLISGGTINQSVAITGSILEGSSSGSTNLDISTNNVGSVGPFAVSGGDFTLETTPSSAGALTVGGLVSASGNITLQTFGAAASGVGNGIFVSAGLTASSGTVTLTSNGTITGGGVITAAILAGSSQGATNLTGANMVAEIGSFTTNPVSVTSDPGSFTLDNAASLAISGPLSATGSESSSFANINITTTGAGHGISVTGDITGTNGTTGSVLTLTSAGTISQTGGTITVSELTGTSVGSTSLTSTTNQITDLATFTTSGATPDFSLTDGTTLTVTGPVSADSGAGNITLTTTSSGNLVLNDSLTGNLVTLTADGTITSSGTGIITASTLTGSSVGSTTLDGNNSITTLDAFTTTVNGGDPGDFSLVNALVSSTPTPDTFTVAGTLTVPGNVFLQTTGFQTTLDINAAIDATQATSIVTLESDGPIAESSTPSQGVITANTLTGSAVGSATFGTSTTTVNNLINNLGNFSVADPVSAGQAFSLTNNEPLTIPAGATVNIGTGNVTLETLGSNNDITIDGALIGGTVTLDASNGGGNITGTGTTTAGMLNENANSSTLTGTQAISSIGNITVNGSYTLNDSVPLTVTGTLDSVTGNITLATTAGNAIVVTSTGELEANGGVLVSTTAGIIQLNAGGPIQADGQIIAGLLTGSSNGQQTNTPNYIGAVFDNANNEIAELGPFKATGGSFVLDDNISLDVVGAVTATTDILEINVTGTPGNLTVSAALTDPLVDLTATGMISEASGGAVVATTLEGNSGTGSTDTATFGQTGNEVLNLGPFTSGGAFQFTNGEELTVSGAVDAGSGAAAVTLATGGTSTSGATVVGQPLTIDAPITGSTVTLNSSGGITQNSAGVIDATTLTGSANTGSGITTPAAVTLTTAANTITDLGAFTSNNGATQITNADPLLLTGNVSAGTGNLTLTTTGATNGLTLGSNTLTGKTVDLVSAAGISGGTATIDATTLTGSSDGAVDLLGPNAFTTLGTFTTTDNTFEVNDTESLTVNTPITVGANTLELETTGAAAKLTINADLNAAGGLVDLISGNTITQSAAGVITAATLEGQSTGNATLTANNLVASLGNFAATGGNLSFTDDAALTITASDTVSGTNVTLTTIGETGSVLNGLTINGTVSAPTGTVDLVSAGGITENAGTGVIDAATLEGSTTQAVGLMGANVIGSLGAFTTDDTGFQLTDGAPLTVNTALNEGTGPLTLDVTGSLAIDAAITGATVTLEATGTLTQNSAGIITATTLTGFADGGATLTSANKITNLGAFDTTGNNALTLTDAHALTVTGAVNTGTGNLSLTTTGANDSLNIDAGLTGGTVHLISSSTIGQNAAGVITAATLTGSSDGAANFGAATNEVANLGAFTTTNGALSLTDGEGLTVNGAINAGTGNITLTTNGTNDAIAVNAALTGAVVDLVSTGAISQTGVITATTLKGSAGGTVVLTSANKITDLGGFTTSGNNGFSLTDAHALTVTGAVNVGTGTLMIVTTGASDNLAIDDPLTGGTVDLVSAGTLTQTAAGIINAATLTGSSVGATTLTSSNKIANLGAFSTAPSGAFSLTDAETLTVTGLVNAGSGTITLTTTGAGSNIVISNIVETTGTINLNAAGSESETSGGGLVTNLLNVTAVSGINNSAGTHNNIKKVGTDKTSSGPNIPT